MIHVFLVSERCLEDHESVVDVVSYWPWENENRIVITNKRDKYALFRNPQVCRQINDLDDDEL